MRVFFQCLAESLAEQGVRAWCKVVLPGAGDVIFDVAKSFLDKYRQRRDERGLREEVGQITQASVAEAQQMGEEVAMALGCSGREHSLIVSYLSRLPAVVRQTQRRKEDPSGRTLSTNLRLENAEDLAQLLPAAMPRFVAGDDVPGMAGWQLQRLLGMGGFGEVWYARHATLQNIPGDAIKFCHSGDLLHEADLINRVLGCGKSPHIVALKGAHLEGKPPWLLYEYIEGGDLGDLIHRWAGLPAAQQQAKVVTALATLSKAIGHFHAMQPPLVHRDLKPANILRDQDDHLYVTDFGIGGVVAQKTLASQHQRTAAGCLQSALYGSHTPLYASPQQVACRDPDPRDDVHALGVIGYQMLTGQMTEGAGPDMAEDLEDLGVDAGLIQLLKRCTARKLERRPANANEVGAVLAGLGVQKTTPRSTVTKVVAPTSLMALADQSFSFKTVFVNAKGKKIDEQAGQARYFTVPLKGLKKGDKPLEMVWLPAGSLQMGGDKYGREKPIHLVQVPAFYMAKMAVTQAQYQAVMKDNPSHFKGTNRPVEQLSWQDAEQFYTRLQTLTGQPYRLPSEAEWEYACRAGSQTPFHFGETITTELANYHGNGRYAKAPKGKYLKGTTEVGSFPPNAFGLYDTHGNVWEWCEDAWHGSYKDDAPTDGSPWQRNDTWQVVRAWANHLRVMRGGAWGNYPHFARSAYRYWRGSDSSYSDLGFRLALGSMGQWSSRPSCPSASHATLFNR